MPAGLSFASVAALARLGLAFAASLRRMRRNSPDALLAMGSYASVGPALAARALRVPVVVHEANAVPGRAIALLARVASSVALTFESASRYLPGRNLCVTGLPLRGDLHGRFEEGVLQPGLFTVLVMGGSQGAHRLNEIATAALCRLRRDGAAVQVVHLTGKDDEAWVRDAYVQAGVPHAVFGFLKEMGKAYNAADLAVCRAGAASCMELAVCGVPSLLVPYPWAMRDHQTANAAELKRAGAADMVAQSDLSADWLAAYVSERLGHPDARAAMRTALRRFAKPDAASRLADLVEKAAAHATPCHIPT
jgi:UDP-N-acetylglucosamine--N-acetylmuramyl-(pentapeptide) pyrophosphoryl-undecaprenol N-acetylglucosamine transferase